MCIMKNCLLPFRFKRIGLCLSFPFLALCVWLLFWGDWDSSLLSWPAFAISFDTIGKKGFLSVIKNDPVNEFAMLGLLLSLCFIALSKERDEDEMTAQIRMQSFVWSLWFTAAVLVFGILFFYGASFLYVSFVAIYLVFIIYIIKFNVTMSAIRRGSK